jgi:hypothetical protein
LPECGDLGVVGPGQTRDRVEQDHHVVAVLDHALGLVDDHLGHLHVPAGGLVEGRADDLRLGGALHFRHFLGPLVDQQHDDLGVLVVGRDRVGHLLQQDRLAGARRRDDQPRCPLPMGVTSRRSACSLFRIGLQESRSSGAAA